MENRVRDERLLQRRCEAFDELVRQPADEADRVRHEIPATVDLEAAGGRVERLEEAIVHGRTRAGERVQQRRLAHVRVARERDGRRLRAAARLSAHGALLPEPAQASPQQRDAPTRQASIRLELRLARASRPDSTAQALEVLPHAAHAREVVLELRELDLQLALRADRVLREDVEDQLRAVDDARLQCVLERALLHRVELVVDDQDLRARHRVGLLQLLELALADVATSVGPPAVLDELGDRLDLGRSRQLAELGQLLLRVLRMNSDEKSALRLDDRRSLRHAGDYAAGERRCRSAS